MVVAVPPRATLLSASIAAIKIPAAAPPNITAQTHHAAPPCASSSSSSALPAAFTDWPVESFTCPPLVLTLTMADAPRTMILPDERSPLIALSSKVTVNVVFGASSTTPTLPRFITAPELAEVAIMLEENIVRPLRAASPLTVTDAASPLLAFPVIVSSPAIRSDAASATIEYVAKTAIIQHIECALRIQSLQFIVLLLYRLQCQVMSRKSNL